MHFQYFTMKEDGAVFSNSFFSFYIFTNLRTSNVNTLFFPLVPLKLHSAATCKLLACDLRVTNKETKNSFNGCINLHGV